MRRPPAKSLLPALLLTLGSLSLTPSCADNNSSMFAVGVIALDPSTCVAEPDDTATMLAGGVIDLAFTQTYTGYLLVGNQLTQRGSREQIRTETSRVNLRGAEIRLMTPDGTQLANYSTVGTGFVNAADGEVASYGAMSVNIIPSALFADPKLDLANKGLVVAKIRVFGDTLGNTAVTSSELDFPIRICTGCLVRYPSDAADTQTMAGGAYKCATASTASSATPLPCIIGQDGSFPCTACSAALELCHDPTQNPSYGP